MKEKINQYISAIKDQSFALVSVILIIIFVQVPHLAYVIGSMGKLVIPWLNYVHAILIALAIDASVLYFAVNGKKSQTLIMMISSVIITMYYYMPELTEFYAREDLYGYFGMLVATVIGVIPPLLVYLVAEQVNQEPTDETMKKEMMILKLRRQGKSYEEIRTRVKSSKDYIAKVLKKHGVS